MNIIDKICCISIFLVFLLQPLINCQTFKPEMILSSGHASNVKSVDISFDNKYIITYDADKKVIIWDVHSGFQLKSFNKKNSSIFSNVLFTPDGKSFIAYCFDKTIRIWDIYTGEEQRKYNVFLHNVENLFLPFEICYSADKNYIITSYYNTRISEFISSVFDLRTGKLLYVDYTGKITSDLKYCVKFPNINSDTLTLTNLISLESNKIFSKFKSSDRYNISEDGKYIVILNYNEASSTIKLINNSDCSTYKKFFIQLPYRENSDLSLSRDGKFITFASTKKNYESIILLVDVSRETIINKFSFNEDYVNPDIGSDVHYLSVGKQLEFSNDNQYLYLPIPSYTNNIFFIDITLNLIRYVNSINPGIEVASYSSDGNHLITESRYGSLINWNLTDYEDIKTKTLNLKNPIVYKNKYSPVSLINNEYNVYSYLKKYFYFISCNKEVIRDSIYYNEEFDYFCTSKDRKYIAIGSRDNGCIKILDINNKEVKDLSIKNINFKSPDISKKFCFSNESSYLFVLNYNEVLKILFLEKYNIETGERLYSIPTNSWYNSKVYISSNGKSIIVAGSKLNLFNATDGKLINTKEIIGLWIQSIAVSNNDSLLLFGTVSGSIELLEFPTLSEIKSYNGHNGAVNDVNFSPDCKKFVSAGSEGMVKIWDKNSSTELLSIIQMDSTDYTVVTPQGYFYNSKGASQYINIVQGLDIIPLESFFEKFFTPGLLTQIYSGSFSPDKSNVPDFNSNLKLPPSIKIINPENGKTFDKDEIQVTVEVTDNGGGINETRLFVDNKILQEVTKKGDIVDLSGNTLYKKYNIKLNSGVNYIKATAFNNDRTESIPTEISVNYNAPKQEVKLYVISVAINKYENTSYNLEYCIPDSKDLIKSLNKCGKDVFADIEVKEFYDENAVKDKIVTGFDEFAKEITEQDVFIFYYSGHGGMTEGLTQDVPQDFYMILQNITQTYGNDKTLKEKGISGNDLSNLCGKIKARKQLVILDACQSGGIKFKGPVEEKALYLLSKGSGVIVMAASGKDEYAKEDKSIGHGVFTYSLLKGMECSENKYLNQGILEIEPLNKYIYDKVQMLIKELKLDPQTPLMISRKQFDFPIGVCK